MKKTEFMAILAENDGMADILQEIVGLAKNQGYQLGFDAGYEASASENDIYEEAM